MAADEVLLEAAVAGIASLRFYEWSEATVSLGYFQPEAVRRGDPLLAGLPFVRRPSGGGTLIHHHELTYALALPAGAPWQMHPMRGMEWLERMHRIIAAALAALGVSTRPAGPENAPFLGFLCFQHFTPGDLLLGPAKVVGSAQRRHRGALMQHGSILLATSPYTPGLPGIRELTGHDLAVADLCRALAREVGWQTGWPVSAGDWTAAQRQRVRELVAAKYASSQWNHKR
jgi:lipoate-protein ligase A